MVTQTPCSNCGTAAEKPGWPRPYGIYTVGQGLKFITIKWRSLKNNLISLSVVLVSVESGTTLFREGIWLPLEQTALRDCHEKWHPWFQVKKGEFGNKTPALYHWQTQRPKIHSSAWLTDLKESQERLLTLDSKQKLGSFHVSVMEIAQARSVTLHCTQRGNNLCSTDQYLKSIHRNLLKETLTGATKGLVEQIDPWPVSAGISILRIETPYSAAPWGKNTDGGWWFPLYFGFLLWRLSLLFAKSKKKNMLKSFSSLSAGWRSAFVLFCGQNNHRYIQNCAQKHTQKQLVPFQDARMKRGTVSSVRASSGDERQTHLWNRSSHLG